MNENDHKPTVDELIAEREGRRWIRLNMPLDRQLADRLLGYTGDFRKRRRDRSLASVIEVASLDALLEHRADILAGPAAASLWRRIADESDRLVEVAVETAQHGSQEAASAAIGILLLDPVESFDIAGPDQARIAIAALGSGEDAVRGMGAEFLDQHQPAELAARIEDLAADPDPRVRAFSWGAAFRLDPAAAYDHAIAIVGDESRPVWQRRSALVGAGQHLQTGEIVELLAFFVQHPNEELALDAAGLFYNHHRNPVIAEAALLSPHEQVRDIGTRLMDPYRGSPAAGGSRPGDPTGADVFADMLRKLGEESEHG